MFSKRKSNDAKKNKIKFNEMLHLLRKLTKKLAKDKIIQKLDSIAIIQVHIETHFIALLVKIECAQ